VVFDKKQWRKWLFEQDVSHAKKVISNGVVGDQEKHCAECGSMGVLDKIDATCPNERFCAQCWQVFDKGTTARALKPTAHSKHSKKRKKKRQNAKLMNGASEISQYTRKDELQDGTRIAVKHNHNQKWTSGVITSYDPQDNKYEILFDGSGQYTMIRMDLDKHDVKVLAGPVRLDICPVDETRLDCVCLLCA
jgi:hypothetical protein